MKQATKWVDLTKNTLINTALGCCLNVLEVYVIEQEFGHTRISLTELNVHLSCDTAVVRLEPGH